MQTILLCYYATVFSRNIYDSTRYILNRFKTYFLYLSFQIHTTCHYEGLTLCSAFHTCFFDLLGKVCGNLFQDLTRVL